MLRRLITAISKPFQMGLIRLRRLLNVNVISAKIIRPLTNNVKNLMTLRPSKKTDYVSVGRFLIFKKLLALIILAACAGIFIYFQVFAMQPEEAPASLIGIKTNITFRYDDIALRDFTGIANIRSFDGGIVFTGEIDRGICRGHGILYARDGGILYEGAFDNNKYNGFGVLYGFGGAVVYEGEFIDNLFHGTGKLYNPRGGVSYNGSFAAGYFHGEGKLYNENGWLIYEGSFVSGLRHGAGVEYHAGGVMHYRGEFFKGAFQGRGELFDRTGRLLYTGSMHEGRINYRALLNASLADVEEAFTETPVVFYQEIDNFIQDAGSIICFFYEQAGIIITTDIIDIRIDPWERDRDNPSAGYYIMPGQITQGIFSARQPSAQPDNPLGNGEAPRPGTWDGSLDFIDRQRQVYFQVDRGVWALEQELDKSKVFIRQVTVIGAAHLPEQAVIPVEDDGLPAIEDCIAIDFIRRQSPTAFANIAFEIDRQNKLFQRVWSIHHADRVPRRAFISDNGIYRFAYHTDSGLAAYFSIESH